jgi:protein-tyrosine-phosphatase
MEKKLQFKVTFVCTQNVFRSMSAHYLALKYLEENNIPDFQIDSCGTIAYSWESPYQHTINLLKNKGVDARKHKNKQIDKNLAEESHFIICMTNDHKNHVKKKFGVESYLFNELALGSATDLEDDNEANFDCSLNKFIEKTVEHIDKHIPKIFSELSKKIIQCNNKF